MEFLAETFGNLIPLLIFIIIPIIRGLNNSKKQKREYERRRSVRKTPYEQPDVPSDGSFRSIIEELRRDVQEKLLMEDSESEENDQEIDESIVEESIDYNDSQTHMPVYDLNRSMRDIEETSMNLNKDSENIDGSLIYSTNPIVQGLIFSEILGPPKSRR